jgi:prephenate dehydrogenase
MSIQITLLGLERIGASAGLALGRPPAQFERTGYDEKSATATQALHIKAVDRLAKDLPQSVRQAQVIFLSVPMHHVREFLQSIAQDVRPEAVILDSSPAKASVAAWVRELLPTRCHYVGISFKLNPKYAFDQDETIAAASADLFEHGEMAIAAPAGTPSQAISLAADLAGVLGARPFFCDLAEMDGLSASTRLLPQLVSNAMLNASLGQPGWRDALKFTGAAYAAASSGIAGREESASLREAALLNKENLLRSLDAAMSALQALRADIENDRAEPLEKKLEAARLGRLELLKEISRPGGQENLPPGGEMPKKEDYLKQQFGFLSKRPAPPKPGEKQD